MLDNLLAWFTGREVNRRRYPRRRSPYRGLMTIDGWRTSSPIIGIDASAGGLCILMQSDPGLAECEFRFALGGRQIAARAKKVWGDSLMHQGKIVQRWGVQFTAISADDWDAIVRWVGGGHTLETNKAQEELVKVRLSPDDTARFLPKVLQDKMLRMLVQRNRLAPLKENQTPLVQYFYSGVTRQHGSPKHRIIIQSKIAGSEDRDMFDTTFLLDDRTKDIAILD